MILVYLDVKEKIIRVYGESGSRKIPFDHAEALVKLLGDRKVMYVTNGRMTNAKAIIAVTRSVARPRGANIDLSNQPPVKEEEPMVLRATSKASITLKDVKLVFKGPWDFYPVNLLKNTHGDDVMENSSIKRFIDSKHLEVVKKAEATKQAEKWQREIDRREESLSSMITDSHDSPPQEDHARDAMEIDLASDVRGSFRPGGGGGGSSIEANETSLLPEDF